MECKKSKKKIRSYILYYKLQERCVMSNSVQRKVNTALSYTFPFIVVIDVQVNQA